MTVAPVDDLVVPDTHVRLMTLLDDSGAQYRRIVHPPEGRTAPASRLRGHPDEQAAKCLVVRVGLGRRNRRYVLAVVPGDCRVDLAGVRDMLKGTDAAFATPEVAEELTGCVRGTILPFSFDDRLELVVDPGLLRHEEIFFNAARLDLSIGLRTRDYLTLAWPRVAPLTEPL